jgi:putative copper export protein
MVREGCFLSLFQACGASFFLAGWGARLAGSAVPIARLGRWAAAAGVLLVLAHQSLEAARMSGEYGGLLDGGLQWLALASTGGAAHGAQALGLLLIVAGLASPPDAPPGAAPEGARTDLAIAGSTLAVLAFTITGHTSVAAHRAVLAPLLAVHLLIVAFWFGALAPLSLVLARESRQVAGWALRRFSAIAVFLVPVIPIAGLALAWGLVPGLAVLHRPYGELLAVKLAGFALLMVFAALNHLRLVPAFVRDGHGGAAPGAVLRGTLAAEMALLAAVFAATAVLTGYYAPDH